MKNSFAMEGSCTPQLHRSEQGLNAEKKAPGSLRLDKIYSYPNPAKAGRVIFFNYAVPESTIPDEVRLEVFTINGELIYSAEDSTISGKFRWYGKNEIGLTVASGIYLYVISAKSEGKEFRSVHKLAIER